MTNNYDDLRLYFILSIFQHFKCMAENENHLLNVTVMLSYKYGYIYTFEFYRDYSIF